MLWCWDMEPKTLRTVLIFPEIFFKDFVSSGGTGGGPPGEGGQDKTIIDLLMRHGGVELLTKGGTCLALGIPSAAEIRFGEVKGHLLSSRTSKRGLRGQ